MEPASTIVGLLGGPAAVARATGTALTAPYRWQYTRAKGGTGGLIPQRHHRALIEFARSQGVVLNADDFLSRCEEGAWASPPCPRDESRMDIESATPRREGGA